VVEALVAKEFSNRSIASELLISENSGENHVPHNLRKPGIASRTQLAA
jgi:DNA-binding CsgD family transcriptional regulator